MLNAALIQRFAPHARKDIVDGLVSGWPAIYAAGIKTPLRLQHFMAQIAVESAGLTRLEENLNYSAERLCQVWPNRFPVVAVAAPYAHDPHKLANKVYGGRYGNVGPDDGWLYRGGGLLQTTFHDNYKAAGYEHNPDSLRHMPGALTAALSYWVKHNCNAYADRDDLAGLRKAIQGGSGGLADAKTWLASAKRVFRTIAPPVVQEPAQRPPADLAISQPPATLAASAPFPAATAAIPPENTTMNGIKGILASKTIWANVITVIGGTTLGAKYLGGVDPGQIVDVVSQAAVVFGPIVSSVFRYRATKQIVAGAQAR